MQAAAAACDRSRAILCSARPYPGLAGDPMRARLRRWLPDPSKVAGMRSLGRLRGRLGDPSLWHLNRRSLSLAASVGLFAAFIPVPTQMPIAAVAAIGLRCNIALSLALCWVTNPLTIPLIYYLCYRLGMLLLGTPHDPGRFVLGWDWLAGNLPAFLLGCGVAGTASALAGFLLVRVAWRVSVLLRWRARARLRAASRAHS